MCYNKRERKAFHFMTYRPYIAKSRGNASVVVEENGTVWCVIAVRRSYNDLNLLNVNAPFWRLQSP